jgi:hypothetical protein
MQQQTMGLLRRPAFKIARPLFTRECLFAGDFGDGIETVFWNLIVATAFGLSRSTAGSGKMHKIEWYRERAADCAHQAARATNEQARAVLKDMAGAWARLAEWREKRHAKDQHDEDRQSE